MLDSVPAASGAEAASSSSSAPEELLFWRLSTMGSELSRLLPRWAWLSAACLSAPARSLLLHAVRGGGAPVRLRQQGQRGAAA